MVVSALAEDAKKDAKTAPAKSKRGLIGSLGYGYGGYGGYGGASSGYGR